MRSPLLLAALALTATVARAQAPTAGWRAEYLTSLAQAEQKYVALAQAVPWAKYAWRPAAGVRSVCEVYLHIAGANYLFSAPLGAPAPASVNVQSIEKCPASRDQVVATMRASFAHLRNAVLATRDADADAPITIFGMKTTKRGMLLMAAEHAGEHLGQSIAYARSNAVVPPWSAGTGG